MGHCFPDALNFARLKLCKGDVMYHTQAGVSGGLRRA